MTRTAPAPLSRRDRVAGAVVALGTGAVAVAAPTAAGPLLLLGAAALLGAALALTEPAAALVLLLTGTFLRDPLHDELPGVPVAGLLIAAGLAGMVLAVARGTLRAPRPGAVEAAMGLYLLATLVSWAVPHDLPALTADGGTLAVLPFIGTGVVLPLVFYPVGRAAGGSGRLVRIVLWWVVVVTAWSGLTAVFQFHGPSRLVWPRFIVEHPAWPGRAVGVFDQPVTNGMLLVTGIVVCLWLGSRPGTPRWRRWGVHGVAAVAVYGVYLTHTRAAWLSAAVVLVAAALLGREYRRGALTILGAAGAAAVVNWAAFTGTDRSAGGVGSSSEVVDRLNLIATSVHALAERPLFGWGIGRFLTVNQRFHEAWSSGTDWSRGFGIVAHETELGIAVELGLVGLTLWLAVLVLLVRRLLRARRGPGADLAGLALLGMVTFVVTGATVDLRFLDFAGGLILLIAGLAVGPGEREARWRPALRSQPAST